MHVKANPGDEDVSTIYGYSEDRGKDLCTLARKQHVAFQAERTLFFVEVTSSNSQQ